MDFKARVHQVVDMIPPGKVATYGQVALWAGKARAHRAVGHILRHSVLAPQLPWHRVINAQGKISTGGDVHRPLLQRQMLEAEGVSFTRSGRCDMKRYQWDGPEALTQWEGPEEDDGLPDF